MEQEQGHHTMILSPADILLGFFLHLGTVSYRKSDGLCYVQALMKAFTTMDKNKDILSIMMRTNTMVMENYGDQMCFFNSPLL